MDFYLDDIAKVIRCHPRTVLRALHDYDPNPYWVPGYNPDYSLTAISKAYGVKGSIFNRCFRGDDIFLKPIEASAEIEIGHRTFKDHNYKASLRKHRTVRYSRISLLDEFWRREEERKNHV